MRKTNTPLDNEWNKEFGSSSNSRNGDIPAIFLSFTLMSNAYDTPYWSVVAQKDKHNN